VHKDAIQDVKGVDGNYPRHECLFRLAVKRLGGESAAINLAAFLHELGKALIDEQMSRKRLIAERRKAALEAERDPGP